MIFCVCLRYYELNENKYKYSLHSTPPNLCEMHKVENCIGIKDFRKYPSSKIKLPPVGFCHLCIISPTLYHSDIASTLGNSKTGSSISKKSIEQVVWVAMKRATSNRYSGHASLFRAFLHKSVFNDIDTSTPTELGCITLFATTI